MNKPDTMFDQVQQFNQRACESALEGMNLFEKQAEKMMNLCIDHAIGVPEQGRKTARMMVTMYKANFDFYRNLLEFSCRNGTAFRENMQSGS